MAKLSAWGYGVGFLSVAGALAFVPACLSLNESNKTGETGGASGKDSGLGDGNWQNGADGSDGADGCDAGLTSCSGVCVDLMSDKNHCGDCATSCGFKSPCNSGQCGCPPCNGQSCGDCSCVCSTCACP